MSIDVFPATVLNSTLWNGQTYEEGTFTVTGVGFSGTAPSGLARYVRVGKQVTVDMPQLQGTSNQPYFVLTGWPVSILPSVPVDLSFPVRLSDSAGTIIFGMLLFTTASAVQLWVTGAGGNWTSSGTKTFFRNMITYLLA